MAQSNGDGYKNTVSPCCEVEIARDGAAFVCSNCGQTIIPEYKLTDETVRLTEMLKAQSNGDETLRRKIRCILGYCETTQHDCLFEGGRTDSQELDEIMRLILADRKQHKLDARIDELEENMSWQFTSEADIFKYIEWQLARHTELKKEREAL